MKTKRSLGKLCITLLCVVLGALLFVPPVMATNAEPPAEQAALHTEAIEAVKEITVDTYQLSDKRTIEQAKADLEKALSLYGNVYTEEESKGIRLEIERLDVLLYSARRVEVVQDAIKQLPFRGDKDDPIIASAISKIENAYAQLSAHEKELIDRKRLNNLLGIIDEYVVTYGHESTWEKGSKYSPAFRTNGKKEMFVEVRLNGETLSPAQYTMTEQGVGINISAAYLEGLSVEHYHTLTFVFTDGMVDCYFRVVPQGTTTSSGPDIPVKFLVAIGACLGGAAGAFCLYNWLKKRKMY